MPILPHVVGSASPARVSKDCISKRQVFGGYAEEAEGSDSAFLAGEVEGNQEGSGWALSAACLVGGCLGQAGLEGSRAEERGS